MANSTIEYTGDGSTIQYAIAFTGGYTEEADISCRVNDEVDGSLEPAYRTLTFINAGLVEIGGAVPLAGESIVLQRTTDITIPVNDFVGGEVLTQAALDAGFYQCMYGIQEAQDNVQATVAAEAAATAAAVSAAAALASQVVVEDGLNALFLGEYAVDPTLDNAGAALTTGSTYFKTGAGPHVYDGTTWLALSTVGVYTEAETDAAIAAYASALGHTHAYSTLTGKPTTLAAAGIADAYTKTASAALMDSKDAAVLVAATSGVANDKAGTDGYTTLPGAIQMRWGQFSNSTDGVQTITFSEPFTTACLYVFIEHQTEKDGFGILDKVTTSFGFNRADGISGTHTWGYMAIGY